MSEATMRSAIEYRLSQVCQRLNATFIAEDMKTTKVDKGPYVMMSILAGDSRRANLGGSRTTRHVGVLQIDCMYPKDSGMGPVTRLATDVGAEFDEWAQSLPDNATVHFRVPTQTNLGVQGEHQRVAISVPYWRDERPKVSRV